MVKIIHAFVTSENKDLKQFYDTLEIFYWRFNPDREFNYIDLDKSTSHPVMHQDPDYILEVLTNHDHADRKSKYNITIDYDYVVLHWIGSTMHGHYGIQHAYKEFLEANENEFLVMGHIIDGKEHGVGRSWDSGNYFFMYPITLVVNLNLYRSIGNPKVGQGITRRHMWTPIRSEDNMHDNYTPLWLKPGDGTQEVDTKSVGWNLISESIKHGYTVYNLPNELRGKKVYTYPDDAPEKFSKVVDSLYNIPVIEQQNQQKWFIESLGRKWGIHVNINTLKEVDAGTVFLFNTEYYVQDKDAYNFYEWEDLRLFAGPASGFKDFVFVFKKYKEFNQELEFLHFDVVQETLDLKKHILKWDGNRNTFHAHIKQFPKYENIKNRLWPKEDRWDIYLDDMFSNFDSAYEFKVRWHEYQNCKHTFTKGNILEDPTFIIEKLSIGEQRRSMLWVSDIFLGTNELVYGIENLKNKWHNLLSSIYVENPNTLLDYKNFDDTPGVNEISNVYEKELIKQNPSFCIYPWMHVQYKPNGQPKPCCRFDLNADEYNNLNNTRFYGDTVFLQQLVPLNSGDVTLDKYPGMEEKTLEELKQQGITGNATVEDVFKSNFWKHMRTKMLKGERIGGCHKCYKEEEICLNENQKVTGFGTSMRIAAIRDWNNTTLDNGYTREIVPMQPIVPKKILYLELGFGNYCNLACRMCSSNLSTTWYEDDVALEGKFDRQVTPKIEDADIKISDETLAGLREIKFTGGEPMIHPNFAKLISRIVALGVAENISLEIFTNCSYTPSEKITKDLTQFKEIRLSLSIDGSDKVNDYIRYPSKWDKVNIAAIHWVSLEKLHKNIKVTINPTITIYNVMYLEELINWWLQIIPEKDNLIVFNYATYPSYLNKLLLPKPIQIKLIEKYKKLSDSVSNKGLKYNFSRLISRLDTTDTFTNSSLQEFYDYTKELDKLRNQNFEEALPELYDAVKSQINLKTL